MLPSEDLWAGMVHLSPWPDVALELAWKSRNMDFCMPYLIQVSLQDVFGCVRQSQKTEILKVLREYTDRVNALDKKTQKKEEEEEKQKSAPNDYVPDYMMPHMAPGALIQQGYVGADVSAGEDAWRAQTHWEAKTHCETHHEAKT
ncbi:chc-1 [Symbiodinium sp. KB8]|nr:chc-1 [Symbiodinium sp. KB8]